MDLLVCRASMYVGVALRGDLQIKADQRRSKNRLYSPVFPLVNTRVGSGSDSYCLVGGQCGYVGRYAHKPTDVTDFLTGGVSKMVELCIAEAPVPQGRFGRSSSRLVLAIHMLDLEIGGGLLQEVQKR